MWKILASSKWIALKVKSQDPSTQSTSSLVLLAQKESQIRTPIPKEINLIMGVTLELQRHIQITQTHQEMKVKN